MWNVGACRFDVMGATQAETQQEFECQCEAQGWGGSRSSDEGAVMALEQRGLAAQLN